MADVQLDDGFTKIANELLEAIMKVNLSSYEFRVVMAIIRKTYGYSKKQDYISLSQLEEITGIKACHICRTLKKLKAKNMIIANGHLTGIQKDYDLWTITQTGNTHLGNKSEKVTQTGNTHLGNKITYLGNEITQTGNKKLPKQVNTKENKETYTKENNIYIPDKKIKYSDFVSMTENEYQKLIKKYGKENTDAFIEKLNAFKGSKGKKYKSDYLAILNWVVEAVLNKGGVNVNNSRNTKRFTNEREDIDERVNKNFYVNV